MFIKRIAITNFKSFDELDLTFGDLNFVIGANASGKSNFVKIFEFIRNISEHGLENAISLEGGIEYLRNIVIGPSEDLNVTITYNPITSSGRVVSRKDKIIGAKQQEAVYKFSIKFNKTRRNYKITRDNLTIIFGFYELEKQKEPGERVKYKEIAKLGDGEFSISVQYKKLKVESKLPEKLAIEEENLFPIPLPDKFQPPHTGVLFLESPFFNFVNGFNNPFDEISVYDFDPRLPKKAVSITGKNELMEDGSNLSIVLSNLLRKRDKKKQFLNLLRDLLPFIDNVNVQKLADKSLLFSLREKYHSGSKYLPAPFVSDGTINIATLILALYFEDQPLVILEEPERNIHPYLIARVVQMLEEVSKKKQIFVTTHNPEIVKYAKIDDLLLVKRDRNGFSKVIRPSESEEVKVFLENEIGIDELYSQNLLGVPNA